MSGYAATIGMFDGVHCGHRFVLHQLTEQARLRRLLPLVVTFDRSPRQEAVLTPLREKLRLIAEAGVQQVEVLTFTPELRAMSAYDFMKHVLRDQFGVRLLLTGYDNHFGHRTTSSLQSVEHGTRHSETVSEGFADYQRYGFELGIDVIGLPPEGVVSSSLIRRQLIAGNVAEASEMLGHDYRLSGCVTHGEHLGTRLGFPTANIIPDESSQIIPGNGVYAVWAETTEGIFPAMMNIGTRPTFGHHKQTLEVHLLRQQVNLYGQPLTVIFVSRLRDELPFSSAEALIDQLRRDATMAENILEKKK